MCALAVFSMFGRLTTWFLFLVIIDRTTRFVSELDRDLRLRRELRVPRPRFSIVSEGDLPPVQSGEVARQPRLLRALVSLLSEHYRPRAGLTVSHTAAAVRSELPLFTDHDVFRISINFNP